MQNSAPSTVVNSVQDYWQCGVCGAVWFTVWRMQCILMHLVQWCIMIFLVCYDALSALWYIWCIMIHLVHYDTPGALWYIWCIMIHLVHYDTPGAL